MQDVKSSFPKHKIVAVHCKGIVENEMNLEKWLNEISKHLKQSKQTISLPMQGVAGLSSSMLHILFTDDPAWAERARALSEKVIDITRLLVELDFHKLDLRLDNQVITYQDSCHL